MSPPLPMHVRRLLRRAVRPPTTVRALVAIMALVATLVTALAVVRISRRHEVIELGYRLSRSAEKLRHARELNRRLELERATLTAPARIEAMATTLGMTAVPPEQIRVVPARQAVASAERGR
jgi:cell division protein FtsL